jgi:hypothetical protein
MQAAARRAEDLGSIVQQLLVHTPPGQEGSLAGQKQHTGVSTAIKDMLYPRGALQNLEEVWLSQHLKPC